MGRRESKRKEIGENTECQALRINLEGNTETPRAFTQENDVIRFGFIRRFWVRCGASAEWARLEGAEPVKILLQ